jgi:hypothetical protein
MALDAGAEAEAGSVREGREDCAKDAKGMQEEEAQDQKVFFATFA